MLRIAAKHPFIVRLSHWLNVPTLAIMVGSGLLIYWAHDVYRVRIGSWTLFRFFPTGFYKALGIPFHLADGMAWHFAFMWLFTLNGLMYTAYTLWSGEWRELMPGRYALHDAWHVVLHDLGLRKDPLPDQKFNAAQQLAYCGIVSAGAGSVLTGLAIYKPVQLAWLTTLLGGYPWVRWEHFWLTMSYVAFVIIHVAQVIRAGWPNFQAMVSGVSLTRVPPAPVTETEAP